MEIFWGIYSAVVIFLIREYYLKSQQQKEIAARLFGYIYHWQTKLLEEDGLFNISYIGIKWQNEMDKKIRKGATPYDLLEINKEFEEKINKLFSFLDTKHDEINATIKEAFERIERTPELKAEFVSQLKNYKSSIIEGKMFITDQDAAKLGHMYSYSCIALKAHLISLVDNAIFFTISFDSKNLEYSEYKHMLKILIKEWIYASKHMQFLSDITKKF